MLINSRHLFLLFSLLIVSGSTVFAQNTDWRHVMDTIKGKPQQVNWIFKTVYFDDQYKPQQLTMLNEGLAMAKQLNNDSLMGKMYLGIGGYYYYSTTEPKKSFPYLQRAKIHFLKSRSYNIIGQVIHPFCDWYVACDMPDSLISVLDRNQPIFKMMTNEKLKIRFQSMYGLAYATLNKKAEALIQYEKALKASDQLHDTPGVVVTCINIAELFANPDSILFWYRKALQYIGDNKPELHADLLYRIGTGYMQYDGVLKDSALYYFLLAEKEEQLLTRPHRMSLYTAMGNYFLAKKEPRIGIGYYQKAFVYSEGGEGNFTALLLHNLAQSYIQINELDSSKYYLDLYKTEIGKAGREKQQMEYYNLKSVYLVATTGDSCSAEVLNNWILSLGYAATIKETSYSLNVLSHLAKCLTKNNKHEKRLEKIAAVTLSYYDSLYLPVKQTTKLKDYSEFLEEYANIEALYGSGEKANALNKELVVILNKMLKDDYEKGVDDALIKYKSEMKDAEIAYGKKTNMYLIAGLIFVFLVGLYIFINLRRTSILNKKITEQKLEVEQLNIVKDRLFSVISHDMRAPLNSLVSFTQLLDGNTITADKFSLYAAELKNTLGYTSGLMDNLLNWARSQMGGYKPAMENFDLATIAADVVNIFNIEAGKKKITISNHISQNTFLHADANMTALLLRNLLSNAIKYTHAGGNIELGATTEKGVVRITVKDFGVGIPADIVEVINNKGSVQPAASKFGTANEKGTGLGLMLCKNFAQLMGGSIFLESKENEGSRFTVELQAAVI